MIVRLIHIYANNIFYSQNKAFLYKITITYLQPSIFSFAIYSSIQGHFWLFFVFLLYNDV